MKNVWGKVVALKYTIQCSCIKFNPVRKLLSEGSRGWGILQQINTQYMFKWLQFCSLFGHCIDNSKKNISRSSRIMLYLIPKHAVEEEFITVNHQWLLYAQPMTN